MSVDAFELNHLVKCWIPIQLLQDLIDIDGNNFWAPPQVRDSHVKDKTVVRPSYLWHGDPYTGKETTLYGDGPLVGVIEKNHPTNLTYESYIRKKGGSVVLIHSPIIALAASSHTRGCQSGTWSPQYLQEYGGRGYGGGCLWAEEDHGFPIHER